MLPVAEVVTREVREVRRGPTYMERLRAVSAATLIPRSGLHGWLALKNPGPKCCAPERIDLRVSAYTVTAQDDEHYQLVAYELRLAQDEAAAMAGGRLVIEEAACCAQKEAERLGALAAGLREMARREVELATAAAYLSDFEEVRARAISRAFLAEDALA